MLEHSSHVKGVAGNVRRAPGTGNHSGRWTLPRAAAFWILAGLFLMLFFASAAASPLYPVYQARFGFSAATLTAVFAVYVLVLLVTLLFLGSVSDYLGRLPVILTALVLSAAGCAVFLAAHDTGALYRPVPAGHRDRPGHRADRGRADRPAATRQPARTAGDQRLLHPGPGPGRADHQHAGPVRPGADAPDLVGAAGRLRRQHPRRAGHGRTRVPAPRRPGLAAAQVAVPRQARATFAAAVPCLVATWALGGLYLSLGPSLAAQETGSPNLLWGGLVIFLLCGTGAAAVSRSAASAPGRPCWPAACSCSRA